VVVVVERYALNFFRSTRLAHSAQSACL